MYFFFSAYHLKKFVMEYMTVVILVMNTVVGKLNLTLCIPSCTSKMVYIFFQLFQNHIIVVIQKFISIYNSKTYYILQKEKLNVNVSITIGSITNLDQTANTFEVKFILELKWTDPALTYVNLNSNGNRNKISEDQKFKLWMPKIKFTNVISGEDVAKFDDEFTTGKIFKTNFSSIGEFSSLTNILNQKLFRAEEG